MKLFAYHSHFYEPLWRIFEKSVREKTTLELIPIDVPTELEGGSYGEELYWRMIN